MADRNVNIRLATQNADRAIQELRAFGKEGEQAFKRITAANKDLDGAGAATEQFQRRVRGALGNVAQQVQDVAVQFQAGTSASIIFAQQGPQILGAFGPLGAVLGAVAGVATVLATNLLGLGEETETATSLTKLFSETLDANSESLRRNVDRIAEADAATRKFAQTRAELAQKSLLAGATSDVNALAGTLRNRAQDEFGPDLPLNTPGLFGSQTVDIERSLAGAVARGDAQRELKAAVESGQGAKAVFDAADKLGLTAGASPATLDAIQALADRANEYAATQALLEAARTGQKPGFVPGEASSFIRNLRESNQKRLDQLATSPAEKIRAVEREAAVSLAKLQEARRQQGADLDAIAAAEEQIQQIRAREIAKIEEQAKKAAEADAKRAAAAARRADAEARKIAEAEAEVEGLKRLQAALNGSAAEYRQVEIQIRAEKEARALGTAATEEEIAAMTKAIVQRERLKDAIAAEMAARRANAEAQADEILKFNKQTADMIAGMLGEGGRDENREVENLQRNLQSNVASAIERGFEDGFGSVGDLVDQFGSLLKSTVASALADSLISKQLAANIQSALNTPIPGGRGATYGQAATGAAGAALGGYAIGQQFAGNRPLGTLGGAAAGAGVGALFGSAVPGVGTLLGAGIGAGIGGLAGFFGSNSTGGTRNNNFQAGFDPLTGLPVEFQNTKPDPQNQGIVGGVLTELAALREGLRAMGLGIGGGEFTVQAGNKSGLTLNGQSFGSASALTEAALRQLLTGATGLSAGQQTVLANSKARDAAGLLGDLAIPEQIQNLLNPMSNFSTALKEQTRIYAEANDNAQRLGLSTKGLAQAQERDRLKLVDAYKVELGIISPLEAQVRNIVDTFDQAIRSAKELGVSEAFLTRQRDKQLSAIRDQLVAQREQATAGFIGSVGSGFGYLDQLRQFQSGLAVSNDNGTAQTRLAEARRQFEMVRRGALGGDIDALNQLTQAGQSYLTAARDYGGSGAVFQDAFKAVNDLLARTISQGETLEQRLLEGIEGQTKTIRDFYRELMNDRREMLEAIRTLERELEMLRKRAA